MIITLLSPILELHGAPTRPSTPKVLRARQCAPCYSVVSSLDSHLSPLKSLGACQKHTPSQHTQMEVDSLKHRLNFKSTYNTLHRSNFYNAKKNINQINFKTKTRKLETHEFAP